MVAFRNVVDGTPFHNFKSHGGNQISFSRGDKGIHPAYLCILSFISVKSV